MVLIYSKYVEAIESIKLLKQPQRMQLLIYILNNIAHMNQL